MNQHIVFSVNIHFHITSFIERTVEQVEETLLVNYISRKICQIYLMCDIRAIFGVILIQLLVDIGFVVITIYELKLSFEFTNS